MKKSTSLLSLNSVFPVLFACVSLTAPAATLTWDPSGAGASGSDGSGTWDSGTNWWNGTADQAWVNNGAIAYIGSGTAGTYNITLNNPNAALTTYFKTSGYTISGGNLTNTNSVYLYPNVSATMNNLLVAGSGSAMVVSNGATLTLAGGLKSLGGNPTFYGTSLTSVLAIPSGTVSIGGIVPIHLTINQTGGAVSGGTYYIGYGGAGTWNISGGTVSIAVGVSRSSAGILNVSGGVFGTTGATGMASIDNNDNATVNLTGGNFNIGIGSAGTPGVTSTSLASLNFMAPGAVAYLASAQLIFNMSAGTLAAKGFQFGSTTASYANNPTCQFNMTGGTLYLDSIGISNATLATNPFTSARAQPPRRHPCRHHQLDRAHADGSGHDQWQCHLSDR